MLNCQFHLLEELYEGNFSAQEIKNSFKKDTNKTRLRFRCQ